jgi:hypothetical protein
MEKSLANLKLHVDPAALRGIVARGDLLKFADAIANQAAAQISAQIVWHVAEASARPAAGNETIAAELAFQEVFVDGEPGFGTGTRFPPRPIVLNAGGAVE